MIIIGVDFHPSMQEIAFLDQETGEYVERQLNHSDGEAEKFYRELAARGAGVRVGMEATGYSRWLERLLAIGNGTQNTTIGERRRGGPAVY
jgi:transposase